MKGFTSAIEAQGGRIVFVNDPQDAKSHHDIRGTSDSELCGYVFSAANSQDIYDTYEVGYCALNKLLDTGLNTDVVMMPNDDWLQGALKAAARRCLKVPEHIGLTGFDATPYGQYGVTPFTSVAQPIKAMAERTVETLFDLIEGRDDAVSPDTRLTCSLVPGETTIPQRAD